MSKKIFAFVLMPFDKQYDDVYKIGIQEAAKEVGIKAERLDDQIFDSNMLEKIYHEIDRADLIIADMSGRNPNVFYEVGYADARKKLVLLLTNKSKDIPFDLLHRPHIIYQGSLTQLRKELAERLQWAKTEIAKREKEPIHVEINIGYTFVDRTDHTDTVVLNLKVEVYNRSELPVTNINSIYLYSGGGWSIMFDDKKVKNTKSDIEPFKKRHIIKPDFNAIPGKDWLPLDLKARKITAQTWLKEELQDKYEIDGLLKLDIHTDRMCYPTETRISTIVEWDDIPF